MASSVTPFKYDIFLTHDWGKDRENHERVVAIAAGLKEKNFKVWLDEEEMTGDVIKKMCDGIEKSAVIGVFITRRYVKKVGKKKDDFCKLEFNHARRVRGASNMIPIVMEEEMTNPITWLGPVGMTLGDTLFVNAVDKDIGSAMERLAAEIARRTDDGDTDSDGSSNDGRADPPGFTATDDDGACSTPGCVCKSSDKQPKVLHDGTMQNVMCPYATCRYHQRGVVFDTSISLLSHVQSKHGDDGIGVAADVWLDVGLVYNREGKLNFRTPSKLRSEVPVVHDSEMGGDSVITVSPGANNTHQVKVEDDSASHVAGSEDIVEDQTDSLSDADEAETKGALEEHNWCGDLWDPTQNELTCIGAIICLPLLILPCLTDFVCICCVTGVDKWYAVRCCAGCSAECMGDCSCGICWEDVCWEL